LAIHASATNAFSAAQELRAALLQEHLDVRVAVHVGDVDRRDDDVSGLGVVVAARILGLANPGEIIASNIAVGATTGHALRFEFRGEHPLKGVPGAWMLYRLADT